MEKNNVETYSYLKCANVLCGWCLNCRLVASDQSSFRSRPLAHTKRMTARSIAARIACRLKGLAGLAQSSCASFAGPRFEHSCQKIVGDGQLSNLGVQIFNVFFIDFCSLPTATLKYA